jgi:hypothetical protein
MASHAIGTHRPERAEDIPFLKQILRGSFYHEMDVYTSVLSVAECQAAYSPGMDKKILNDEVKQLFRDILTSGQYVVLVQPTILIAERARNLYWAHDLSFGGADAMHLASALEMRCDEYLTFDDKIHKKAQGLEKLGISVVLPRNTKSLDEAAAERARMEIARLTQADLFEHAEAEAARPSEDGDILEQK